MNQAEVVLQEKAYQRQLVAESLDMKSRGASLMQHHVKNTWYCKSLAISRALHDTDISPTTREWSRVANISALIYRAKTRLDRRWEELRDSGACEELYAELRVIDARFERRCTRLLEFVDRVVSPREFRRTVWWGDTPLMSIVE